MLTDQITDLSALLRCKPALIVHFSGVPKGLGHPVNYPKDLAGALVNRDEIICCSTIEPGDFTKRPVAASGFVGVVIAPIDEASVIRVHHDDVGSAPTTAARKLLDYPTSVANCLRSFTRDGCLPYNEWLVGPYRVVGLFVASDAQIQEPNRNYRDITHDEVLIDLGNSRLFSCRGNQFVELEPAGNWKLLDMATVYPWTGRCADSNKKPASESETGAIA